MKKILVGTFALCLTTIATANDFKCKEIYDKKIQRLNNSSLIREVGRTVLLTSGSVVAMGGIFLAVSSGVLTPVGLVFFGTLFGAGPGIAFRNDVNFHEQAIEASYEAQTLLQTSYDEIISKIEQQRLTILEVAIKRFEAKVTYPEFLNELVQTTNIQRRSQGLPALPQEEVIKLTKEKIQNDILNEKITVWNSISEGLEYSKSEKWIASETTYDQFRQYLNENQDLFCRNGKALGLKKALRMHFNQ